ncbi:MAG TPA: Calx-beta domain-containing protein, partial [Verrucomicrobiae bacterium]|nr:Calx-beta domain-containing protein [Verrucomicrobiae bacterium]
PTNFAPISVGSVEANYLTIPVLDDIAEEGDEQLDLSFIRPSGSITLGGEVIPLGGALGRSSSKLTIADNDFSRGVFNFLQPVFFTNELAPGGLAQITVIRTNGSAGRVTVDWMITTNVAPPRATPFLDYSTNALKGTLTFNPGVTSRVFTVIINRDSELEFDENVGLILTNATSGAKLPAGLATSIATATLTIIDNNFPPGRINFVTDNFAVNEAEGEATITVTRTGGSDSQVSVDYQTINGTATAPADYTNTTGTLFWDSGDTASKTFKVPLRMDGLVEGTETVRLRLTNPLVRGLTETNLLGQRASSTLAILDGDSYGLVGFRQPFYQCDENGGAIDITIFRSVGTSGSGSVQFAAIPDTALAGQDFTPVSGTLNFGPGEIGKTFQVPILDDNLSDGNRTVFLQLSSPVNVGLAAPSTVMLSIVDNESFREPPGDLDVAFREDTAANGPVYAIAPQYTAGLPDGRLMVAGDFTEFNEVTRNRMARLLTNGLLDTSFNPGVGANASIRTIAVQRDGKILVGGFFNSIVNTNMNGIARLSHDGTLDESFNPGAAGDVAAIHAIVIQPDDKILVGGAFSKFNNLQSPGIVRLTTNGVVDRAFNVGGGANAAVYAIAIQNDGKILIGGDFTTVNNVFSPRLARLNVNGSVDSSFNIGAGGVNGAVRAIVVQPDGKILIGGSFTGVGNTPRSYLARLEQSGTVDTTFLNSDLGADNAVYALALQVDGRVVVVGDFARVNGVGRNRITRLMPDGSTDPSINFGAGANSFISALYLQPDRKIVIGGGFTTYDEQPRRHIARLYGGTIAGSGGVEFSRAEYSVNENGSNALVTVRRRGGTAGIITADFRTTNLTAFAGLDYVSTNGTLMFPQGETEKQFVVRILDNSTPNEDRVARLELFNYTGGATNGPKPTSRLVIRNDEVLVGFLNTNYVTSEGVASGVQSIAVRRTLGSNTAFSIEFETTSGTAIIPDDFVRTNGVLSFLPGEMTKSFQVPIIDDTLIEGTESLNLRLFNPSAKTFLALDRATLEIHDNDFAPGQLYLTSSNYVVDEAGGYVEIGIVRTNGSTGFISVQLATQDITATSGLDYVGTNTTIAFGDGETLKIMRIPILIDFQPEATETFGVNIFNPAGGAVVLAPSNAIVSINNNDRPYGTFVFSTNFKAFVENGGTGSVIINRINGSLSNVTVNLTTSSSGGPGSATPGADFVGITNTLTFPPGLTTMVVPITLLDDSLQEGAESFNVTLSGASSGAAVGSPNVCTVQIIDNDSPILVAAGATLVSETISNNVIDPGERVTLRLGIRNIGFTNTANLVATVQTTGGVLNPSPASASYGIVAANGPTNFQNFALTANVTNTGLLTVTLALSDSGRNLGTVSYTFRVGSLTYTFANTNRIIINDNTNASPYPSSIFVADVFGTITKVTATVSNMSHTYPGDIDILLVSPAGDAVMLMSDAGGYDFQNHPIDNVTIRYTDSAPSAPPRLGQLTSGDCLPSNWSDDDSLAQDFFPLPAPAATGTWATNMYKFNGKNANGVWSLYVMDDTTLDTGLIANGWSISITTSTPVNDTPPTIQYIGTLANGDYRLAIRGQPGLRYALNGSTDLKNYSMIQTFVMPNGGIYYYAEPRNSDCKFFRASKLP